MTEQLQNLLQGYENQVVEPNHFGKQSLGKKHQNLEGLKLQKLFGVFRRFF